MITLTGPRGRITRLHWVDNNRHLLSSSEDGMVRGCCGLAEVVCSARDGCLLHEQLYAMPPQPCMRCTVRRHPPTACLGSP